MATVIIKATGIDDVDLWKRGFDLNAERRRALGYLSYRMFRDPNDPKTIVVVSEVESLERARGLAGDTTIRDVMIEHGVKGPPEVLFLEESARG
jgi:hypothetical protein